MLTLRLAHATGLEHSASSAVDNCIFYVCGYFPNNKLKITRFRHLCLMEKSVKHYTVWFHDLHLLLGDTGGGKHRGVVLGICVLPCNSCFAAG